MRTRLPAPGRTISAGRRPHRRPPHPGPAGAIALGLLAALALAPASAGAAGSLVSLRVVGAAPVPSITSFPFQVGMFIQSPGGGFGAQATLAFCGGVIIDPTQVLTAAHCVSNELSGAPVPPASVTLLAGTAMLPPAVPTQPVAASIAIDPHYDTRTADYDLAVVTLTAPLYTGSPRPDGTAAIAPIPLITPALATRFANPNLSPAEPVTISGWGETAPLGVGAQDDSADLPHQLQAAQTHLVPDATCAAQYASLGSLGVPAITPRMLCAGEPTGGIDACSGDSGGPLVVDVDSPAAPPGDYVLAGLIDFGAGCAQPGFPGVYVRLATPEIAAFIGQQAAAQGQQLAAAPAPAGIAPVRRMLAGSGTASIAAASGRVSSRVARVAVRCRRATCTGTITLRTTTTVGIAHFAIAANTTKRVPVRITPRGREQLVRHGHRLLTRATLRTTGAPATQRAFTLTG
ncbi:MAG: transrane protease serine [Solirubrobacteraceae bacterium]|nr:transrane protease serine [Solirubrobacteraceae bacterium]